MKLKEMKGYEEFSSVFKGAIKPKLTIIHKPIKKIFIVIDHTDKTDGLLAIASELVDRFACEVSIYSEEAGLRGKKAFLERLKKQAPKCKVVQRKSEIHSTQILEHMSAEKPSLVLLSTPFNERAQEGTLGSTIDIVLRKTRIPVLLVKGKVKSPKKVFSNILTYIPGMWGANEELSYSLTLAEEKGYLELLHVLEEEDISQLKHAIEITPGISAEEFSSKLVENFKKEITQLLESAVKEGKKENIRTKSHIMVGDPVEACKDHIKNQGKTLLIIRTKYGKRKVEVESYELARVVQSVPVLVM